MSTPRTDALAARLIAMVEPDAPANVIVEAFTAILVHASALEHELEMAKAAHCRDCCCAQSWAALGVTEYDGKSIPEHITALRARVDLLRFEQTEHAVTKAARLAAEQDIAEALSHRDGWKASFQNENARHQKACRACDEVRTTLAEAVAVGTEALKECVIGVVRSLVKRDDQYEVLPINVARIDDALAAARAALTRLAAFGTGTSKGITVSLDLQKLLAIATAALERIAKCEDAPDIDATGEWQTGLHCGVEDRDCQDRYQGADYGHAVGVEKGLEWASNEAKHALKQMTHSEPGTSKAVSRDVLEQTVKALELWAWHVTNNTFSPDPSSLKKLADCQCAALTAARAELARTAPSSDTHCPKCGHPWKEHEIGVPAPYCPAPAVAKP